jgi:hypothetical protein
MKIYKHKLETHKLTTKFLQPQIFLPLFGPSLPIVRITTFTWHKQSGPKSLRLKLVLYLELLQLLEFEELERIESIENSNFSFFVLGS